jgi:hypothetical protein
MKCAKTYLSSQNKFKDGAHRGSAEINVGRNVARIAKTMPKFTIFANKIQERYEKTLA